MLDLSTRVRSIVLIGRSSVDCRPPQLSYETILVV
jgi:hypothetical protein